MVKKSFGNCLACPLVNEPIVIGETNSGDDLRQIELVVLAEAPAKEEIEQHRPLVGKAGKVFRSAFESLKLNQIPCFITNIVLCSNIIDGKTVNPPKEAVEACRPNWRTLLKLINPKVVIIMGDSAAKSIGIEIKNMASSRGKIYEKDGYNFFLTYHPSFVARKGGLDTDEGRLFLKDFQTISEMFKIKTVEKVKEPVKEEPKKTLKQPHFFNIPEWIFDKDITLFDIQRMPLKGQILYTLKSKDGKKKYYTTSDSNYYYYEKTGNFYDAESLTQISDVNLIMGPAPKDFEKAYYESDVKVEIKHSIDYYLQRKEPEPELSLNVLYFDIEVFLNETREFPDPKKALSAINAISYKLNDSKVTVLIADSDQIDKKPFNVNDTIEVKVLAGERALLTEFSKVIKTLNPDLLAGWNCLNFDMFYICNRMKKLGLNLDLLSPYGHTLFNDNRYGDINIYGLYIVDMLDLYKTYVQNKEESYKLGAIARKHLGEDKVEFEGSLDNLYMTNLSKFIEYSAQDTNLLYGLDKKLEHIRLRNEIRKIASSTWKSTDHTIGIIDPLCISFAKKMGLVCKNSELGEKKDKLVGAFVKYPIPGIHPWIIDFDFTSLYPSIIISTNCGPNTYVASIDENSAYDYIYKREVFEKKKNIEVTLDPMKKNQKKKTMTLSEFNDFIKENEAVVTIAGTIFIGQKKEVSFFNKILRILLDSRIEYKNKMKDAKREGDDFHKGIYDNVQLAYKTISNSIYGVLAQSSFRFFKLDLAKTVTLTGQEVSKFASFHLSKYMKNNDMSINPDFMENFEKDPLKYYLYGDTDSSFIQLGDYLVDQKKLQL